MRIAYLILGLSVLAGNVHAQKKKTAGQPNPAPYAATITEADLSKHLYILAGPAMEGRETATPGQQAAATYIEQYFKGIGLKPGFNGSYQMPFPVYRDTLLSSRIMVNGSAYALDAEFQPNLRITRSGSQYFSEFVFAGHGIVDSLQDDYAGVEVRGKAVVLLDGAPDNYKNSDRGMMGPAAPIGKYNNALRKGAAAVLIVARDFPRKPSVAPGNMYVNLYSPEHPSPLYSISGKVATALLGSSYDTLVMVGKTTRLAATTVKANLMLEIRKELQELSSTNVLGYIEGTDKTDEWLVITAHYDHLGMRNGKIYYGADDDGSGTVGIMEIAEAFAKAKAEGKGPRRNVMIMAVSGEEKGLWGSAWFSDHSPIPLEKITANLNIDMIGRVDTERKTPDTLNYVYVVGDNKISTELKALSEGINSKYIKMTLDYKYNDDNDPNRIYFRSDHYNFARKGVPVIFYYDGMLKADYHAPTDTPDKINYALCAKRAKLVFFTAWEMANRDKMMVRDLPIPTMTR
ncbi:M28 family peptidase [Flavihumibacter rivuli]|uniref:M28 family peptidase n=1 Tax=Flavihumibacter rivuli TaxID=2838156 RepID=UPI001BDE948E|nr:M28 family peptidase [Flavihumibacter rivuli]ULQ55734.1 M28 family peptidase [Flavihumibacter rivuli]